MTELINLGLQQLPESKADLQEILPTYGSDKAAAFDLRADLKGRDIKVLWECSGYTVNGCSGTFSLEPSSRVLIPTGFIFNIPEGFQMNIYSRSGMSWKNGVIVLDAPNNNWGTGLIVLNAPAVIDEDYTDETFVMLYNTSDKPFAIEHGMRIAQAEINPVYRVDMGSLGERKGGFGSSGG